MHDEVFPVRDIPARALHLSDGAWYHGLAMEDDALDAVPAVLSASLADLTRWDFVS